ncbi:hypothetical protein MTP99_009739 [Tenebrio molitor]|nr:hypothetical protein MTP99_009739 [Tenebrio molitor]
MSQCKKFAPNIFHKTKCSNCFRQKEEHSAEALECNRVSPATCAFRYIRTVPKKSSGVDPSAAPPLLP